MANPTSRSKHDIAGSFKNGALQAEQFIDENGKVVVTTQQANVADVAAPTAYSAHASGATAVTSNAATDLDTTAAALATLVTEVTAYGVKINAILDVLEAHGLMADA